MSEDGNPHTPTRFQEDFDLRLQDRTPIHNNYDAPEDTSKANCLWFMDSGWFRALDSKEVERRRRAQIQNPPYHRARIDTLLGMIRRYVSKFELPELLKTTDDLNRLISDLGATPGDFENAQRETSETVTDFWDHEYAFHERRKEEIERKGIGRSSYKYDDVPPTSPTRTPALPLAARSPNRRSPSSNGASKGAHRRVFNARVQKRHSNESRRGRKQRNTRASGRREPSLQAREEEPGTGASLESALGREPIMTTLSEKIVPPAPASRRRAAKKTRPAEKPRQSGRVRKSTRIQERKRQEETAFGDYNLRTKHHTGRCDKMSRALQKSSQPARRG